MVGYFGDNPPPLITDGRFSGGSKGILVANLPDAYKEDSILPYLINGDIIELDLVNKQINVTLEEHEIVNRVMSIDIYKPELPIKTGYVAEFGRYVGGLCDGYVTS